MIKGLFDTVGLGGVIGRTTKHLNEKFTEKEYFELDEVDAVLDELEIKKHKELPFVYSAHCKAQVFYARFDHTEHEYETVRFKVAKSCFGSELPFTANLLTQYSNGSIKYINESFVNLSGGSTSSSGPGITDGGSGGGCDGGSC